MKSPRRIDCTTLTVPENAAHFVEDAEGNYAMILVKDLSYIEEPDPNSPTDLRYVMKDGSVYYNLLSAKAVAQLNEELKKNREQDIQ